MSVNRICLLAPIVLLAACTSQSPPSAQMAAAPSPANAEQTPAGAGQVGPSPSTESLTISFANSGAVLSQQANRQLDAAARLYRDARPEIMIVAGHSDSSGDEFRNLLLSARRAQAVKRGLVDRGVPADRLQIVAIGDAEITPGNAPQRAAVVTWR